MSRRIVVDKNTKSASKSRRGNQFDYSEIYRQLRTNIEFSSIENKVQVVNVTSTTPNEGKSSVSSNLAIICSDKYEKVLLIDCDLRKPVQHKFFNTTNKVGLSNLLLSYKDKIDIDDETYFKRYKKDTSAGKLYLLTSGSKVPNPQELLSSKRFKRLIEELKKEFGFIIIDCPPISAVSDAIPVASVSDGTLFVCSAKDTNKKEAKDALVQLKRNGVNVLGCVLTKVEDPSNKKYGYYYGGGETI